MAKKCPTQGELSLPPAGGKKCAEDCDECDECETGSTGSTRNTGRAAKIFWAGSFECKIF